MIFQLLLLFYPIGILLVLFCSQPRQGQKYNAGIIVFRDGKSDALYWIDRSID